MSSLANDQERKPKRGAGEGSIYQRDDGVWVGRIMLGRKADGKPDRPKVTGKTRRDVQRQLAKLREKADQRTRVDPSKERQTVAQFMDTWLAGVQVREQTKAVYARFVRVHIAEPLGRYRLSALQAETIQTFYVAKVAQGLAPNTIRKIHSILHRALKMAVRRKYLPNNPTDDVDVPRGPKYEIHPPSPSELTQLIEAAAATDDRLAVLWTLAIYSGCRQGELLGLRWQDIDFDRATLTVQHTLTGTASHVPQFGDPKSNTSRRTISLPAVAVQALRTQKARQAKERLKADEWADYGLVFCTRLGTPLAARNVQRDFKAALARAGLHETVRFHDLRHAHATLMLRAGTPLKVASQRLGHSTIAVTADIYSHVTPDMDLDAAERVARAMDAAGS